MWFLTPILIGGCSFDSTFFPIDGRPDDAIFPDRENIVLESSDGNSIHHVLVKPQPEAKATIFVFQGSGSKVSNWLKLLQPLVDNGYQVFLMEYRGFGQSEGKPGHRAAAADAYRALTYLVEREDVKDKKLVVLGQSYGGQLAISVAAKYPNHINALVTEGTFTSFRDIAIYSTEWIARPFTWIFFSNPYSAAQLIKEVPIPILIIHSKDDEVVPFYMGQDLYDLAGGEKDFWEISGKHTDALIDFPEEFVRKLDQLVESTNEPISGPDKSSSTIFIGH